MPLPLSPATAACQVSQAEKARGQNVRLLAVRPVAEDGGRAESLPPANGADSGDCGVNAG